MLADLVGLSYRGSYDRVAAFARKCWRRESVAALIAGGGTFVPLVATPGEAFQFYWGEDRMAIGDERMKLEIPHLKLAHSGGVTLRGYRQETREMPFDPHNHALRVPGGVPTCALCDNMKMAVDRIACGKARMVNERFNAMTSDYLREATFFNPASGWESVQMEKNVQDTR